MTLRPASSADAEAICAIYNPLVEHTPITFETEPVSAEAMRERIAAVSERLPYLVADDQGQVAGYAYASLHRKRAAYQWAAETSIFVHADHRGKGLGRALTEALLRELTQLGYLTAWAGITLPNPASLALHEALGFERCALYEAVGFKAGAWRDVVWLRRQLAPLPSQPVAPRTWRPTGDAAG